VTEEQVIKDVVTVVSEQVEVVVVGFGEVVELVVVEAGGGWPDPSWLNKLTRPPSTKTTRVNKIPQVSHPQPCQRWGKHEHTNT